MVSSCIIAIFNGEVAAKNHSRYASEFAYGGTAKNMAIQLGGEHLQTKYDSLRPMIHLKTNGVMDIFCPNSSKTVKTFNNWKANGKTALQFQSPTDFCPHTLKNQNVSIAETLVYLH